MSSHLAPDVLDRPVPAHAHPGALPEIHRVLTMHTEMNATVRLAVLDAVDSALRERGATRVWIDPASGSQLVVLAEWPA